MTDITNELIIKELQNAIDDKNRMLFNAFSLAMPELFKKDHPYDWEFMRGLNQAFYDYCDKLDVMGKLELYAG